MVAVVVAVAVVAVAVAVAVASMTDLLAGVMEEQEEALRAWSTGSKLMVH